MAIADPSFLNSIYLAACRLLWKGGYQAEYFQQLSTYYKIMCIRSVNSEISQATPVSELTICKVTMLSWDEVRLQLSSPDCEYD
jgi:hypothetical protein